MVFFWKWYATAKAKKPQKKVVCSLKLKILVYFGGMGPVGGRVWNQGGQNIEKGNRCQPHLEVILEAFFVVLADVFLVHFQGRSQLAPRSI